MIPPYNKKKVHANKLCKWMILTAMFSLNMTMWVQLYGGLWVGCLLMGFIYVGICIFICLRCVSLYRIIMYISLGICNGMDGAG